MKFYNFKLISVCSFNFVILQRVYLDFPSPDPNVVHHPVNAGQPWEWTGTPKKGWHRWIYIADGAALVPVTFTEVAQDLRNRPQFRDLIYARLPFIRRRNFPPPLPLD